MGPILIAAASVRCANFEVTFDIETEGVGGDARVYSQETGSSSPEQWADIHGLSSYQYDQVCGTHDRLGRTLTTEASPGTDQRDYSSIFSCDQYEDNEYMTFAFGIFDAAGSLTDCCTFGHDPVGMSTGIYEVSQEPDFDLTVCRFGEEAT